MPSVISKASIAAAFVVTVAWSPVPTTIRAGAQPADYFQFPLPSWEPHCLGFGSEWRYCNGTVLRRCSGSGAVWVHPGGDIKTEVQPGMAAGNDGTIGHHADPTVPAGSFTRPETPVGRTRTRDGRAGGTCGGKGSRCGGGPGHRGALDRGRRWGAFPTVAHVGLVVIAIAGRWSADDRRA